MNTEEQKSKYDYNKDGFIDQIDKTKFVKCNIYFDSETQLYYPVIDPNGKSYISLKTCLDLSNCKP